MSSSPTCYGDPRDKSSPLSLKGDYSGRSYSRPFAVYFWQAEWMPGCCHKLHGCLLKGRGLQHPKEDAAVLRNLGSGSKDLNEKREVLQRAWENTSPDIRGVNMKDGLVPPRAKATYWVCGKSLSHKATFKQLYHVAATSHAQGDHADPQSK